MPTSVQTRAKRLLRKLEWSGIRLGMGNGPHGSGGDGCQYKACPVCRGVHREGRREFVASAIGHRDDCELAVVLKERW